MKATEDNAAPTIHRGIPSPDQLSVIRMMQECLREVIGQEAGITVDAGPHQIFVVALPADLTEEQRAEVDYRLQELGWIFRYVDNGGK